MKFVEYRKLNGINFIFFTFKRWMNAISYLILRGEVGWVSFFFWDFDTPPLKQEKLPLLIICFQCYNQCWTNIRIFKYIQIFLDKYIHLSKYSSIFSKANIFGYSFVIYLCWRIYSDIHSSNIYDSKYIWIFIVSQKRLKIVIISPKWFNMVPK